LGVIGQLTGFGDVQSLVWLFGALTDWFIFALQTNLVLLAK